MFTKHRLPYQWRLTWDNALSFLLKPLVVRGQQPPASNHLRFYKNGTTSLRNAAPPALLWIIGAVIIPSPSDISTQRGGVTMTLIGLQRYWMGCLIATTHPMPHTQLRIYNISILFLKRASQLVYILDPQEHGSAPGFIRMIVSS